MTLSQEGVDCVSEMLAWERVRKDFTEEMGTI